MSTQKHKLFASSKNIKIIADKQISLARTVFSEFGEVEQVNGREINSDMVETANVLLVRSVTKVSESLLKYSKVSFVASATSGIDHIDTDYLKASGITFANAPGSNARSVAEYVLSSLFVLSEQRGFELTDKTIGIIGCGQVGSRVKHFLETLGINCVVNDPPLAAQQEDHNFVTLEEIAEADIITLHLPLTSTGKYPSNKLIDKNFLAKLKPEVTIINTARGEVIDEAALLDFKHRNKASTLILDVWCNEPTININLLRETFIATPHIAGYSYSAKLKSSAMLFDALNEHLGKKRQRPSALALPPKLINIDNNDIQLAVLRSYDVRADAIALTHLDNTETNQRGAYFDSLRKNYPIRYEFSNQHIESSNIDIDTRKKLQKLGFNLNVI